MFQSTDDDLNFDEVILNNFNSITDNNDYIIEFFQ